MRNEICFNLDVAGEGATRADFTYKLTRNTITITDTTLRKLSVTKDMLSCARLEHWHQGSIAAFKIMMSAGFGTVFGGTASVRPFLLCAKPMRKRRWQNCCAKMQNAAKEARRPYSFDERRHPKSLFH